MEVCDSNVGFMRPWALQLQPQLLWYGSTKVLIRKNQNQQWKKKIPKHYKQKYRAYEEKETSRVEGGSPESHQRWMWWLVVDSGMVFYQGVRAESESRLSDTEEQKRNSRNRSVASVSHRKPKIPPNNNPNANV